MSNTRGSRSPCRVLGAWCYAMMYSSRLGAGTTTQKIKDESILWHPHIQYMLPNAHGVSRHVVGAVYVLWMEETPAAGEDDVFSLGCASILRRLRFMDEAG